MSLRLQRASIITRLNVINNEFLNAEAEYSLALKQDKEFSVLKPLRTRMRELKTQISFYAEALNTCDSIIYSEATVA